MRLVAVSRTDHTIDFRDEDGWWDGYIKWDGCMEITNHMNSPLPHSCEADGLGACQQLHVCGRRGLEDLKEAIEQAIGLGASLPTWDGY